jgi:hypothetical protein
LIIRAGVPQPGGALVDAARNSGIPTLFSANAFSKYDSTGRFSGFRLSAAERLGDMDAALDSAGFVAAVKYRDYPWSIWQYVQLAAARPWAWWASMDFCVEPEIASNAIEKYVRMAATARYYVLCKQEAERAGISAPMPVLQGWTPDDYLKTADMIDLDGISRPLIGIGSVCRRQLGGPDGLMSIIDQLDRRLPKSLRFHLFGVKSDALDYLDQHPRIASVDSMAWDFSVRVNHRTGRTQALRGEAMVDWHGRQVSRGGRRWRHQDSLDLPMDRSLRDRIEEVVSAYYEGMVSDGDMDYGDARWHSIQDMLAIDQALKSPELPSWLDGDETPFELGDVWRKVVPLLGAPAASLFD